MKYYLMRSPSDPRIIGIKDGGSQAEIDQKGFGDKESYNRLRQFFQMANYWSHNSFVPDFEVNIEYAALLKHAKATDFLRFRPYLIGCNFMVSERAKILLEQFTLPEHYFYPVPIYNQSQLVSVYYVFYCPLLTYDVIDFSQSLFFTGSELTGKKIHSFADQSEYITFQKGIVLNAEKIVLNDSFDRQLDLFNPRFTAVMYVSDRLKNAIQAANLTGVNILEPRDPIIELGQPSEWLKHILIRKYSTITRSEQKLLMVEFDFHSTSLLLGWLSRNMVGNGQIL